MTARGELRLAIAGRIGILFRCHRIGVDSLRQSQALDSVGARNGGNDMSKSMTDDELSTGKSVFISRKSIVEAIVGAVLLVLAFAAIAASDVSTGETRVYWIGLVVIFALVAIAINRLYPKPDTSFGPTALRILLHWFGVFLAIELVYFFVGSGRIANADTGLTIATVLALGAYLAGVHGNWRLMVIGVAIGLAAAGAAFMEEYLWVMFGLAVLVIVIFALSSRRSQGATAATVDDF